MSSTKEKAMRLAVGIVKEIVEEQSEEIANRVIETGDFEGTPGFDGGTDEEMDAFIETITSGVNEVLGAVRRAIQDFPDRGTPPTSLFEQWKRKGQIAKWCGA